MVSLKKLVGINIPIIDNFEKIYVIKDFKVQFIYTYNFLPLKKLLFYISPSSYDKIIYLFIDNVNISHDTREVFLIQYIFFLLS